MADLSKLRKIATSLAETLAAAEADLVSQRRRVDEARTPRDRETGLRQLARGTARLEEIFAAETLGAAVKAVDPVAALASLEATHPIVMLPVRLETRFRQAAGRWTLLVRVYPDHVHQDGHEPRLTAVEREAGGRYWSQAATAEPAAWAQLALAFGAPRAAWIRRATGPGAADPGTASGPFTRGTRTDVLPDVFWCVAWRDGVEVARAHGSPVRDPLLLAPDPRIAASANGLDTASQWLVDHAAAQAAGMAVTLDLGADGAKGVDRLLVYGVKASADPAGGAARLARLIDAHHYSDGIGLVPRATATNNSERSRSGWSGTEPADAAASHRIEVDASLLDHGPGAMSLADAQRAVATDGARLAAALGIPASHLAHVEGTQETSELDARAMLVALWPGVAGYGLRQFFGRSVSSDVATALQEHAIAWVRSGGPFAAVRVGRQPYGILPITSLSRFQPVPADNGWLPEIVNGIRRFAGVWRTASASVPRVGHGDPGRAISEILALSPVSLGYRLRREADAQLIEILGQLAGIPAAEIAAVLGVHDRLVAAGMKAAGRFAAGDGVLSLLGFSRSAPLSRDLVQGGALSATAPLADNYLTYLRTASASDILNDTARLKGPLLYLLLRASVLAQFLDDGVKLVGLPVTREELMDRFVRVDIDMRGPLDLLRDILKKPVPLRPGAVVQPVAVEDIFTTVIERVGDAPMNLRDRPLTGGPTVIGFGGKAAWPLPFDDRQFGGGSTGIPGPGWDAMPRGGGGGIPPTASASSAAPPAADGTPAERRSIPTERLKNLADATLDLRLGMVDVAAALATLEKRPSLTLDRLLRETLDLGAHRLDAWITSLATARLAQLRETNPDGAHLGAYSWVVDLRPKLSQSAGGFVHAPSVAHAATAAVLRSAHLARGNKSELAINLSSARVRNALRVLDSVRAGGRVGQVLGTLFEEDLIARRAPAAVGPARIAAPLAGSVGAGSTPGACDGESLLRAVERGEVTAASLAADSGVPATERAALQTAIAAALASLTDAADAMGDLLLAESVHQLASHNLPRAVAAMAAASGGPPPEDYDVIRIAPEGVGVTHRLAVIHRGSVPAPATPTLRAILDPFLDAWLRSLLAPFDGAGIDVTRDDRTGARTTIADLALAPADIVALAGTAPSRPGEVTVPLVRLLVSRATDAAARAGGVITGLDVAGVEHVVSIAQAIAHLLAGARAFDPKDLPPSYTAAGVTMSATEARDRVVAALEMVAQTITSGDLALTSKTNGATLRAALTALVKAGVTTAVPTVAGVSDTEVAQLKDEVRRGIQQLRQRHQAATVEMAGPLNQASPPATASLDAILTSLRSAATALAGERALLMVSMTCAPLDAALTDRPIAGGGQTAEARQRAARQLLRDVAQIREPAGHAVRLRQLLQGAKQPPPLVDLVQLTGGPSAHDPWVGLGDPSRANQSMAIAGGRISMTTLASGLASQAGRPALGFILDEWTESVPSRTLTTALAVHANRPSNEAPQAILVAVPPDAATVWNQDTLEATLLETIELAQMRAVDLPALGSLGQIVPMLHLPVAGLSFNKDVQWWQLVRGGPA